jgi:hypothetical protein
VRAASEHIIINKETPCIREPHPISGRSALSVLTKIFQLGPSGIRHEKSLNPRPSTEIFLMGQYINLVIPACPESFFSLQPDSSGDAGGDVRVVQECPCLPISMHLIDSFVQVFFFIECYPELCTIIIK